MRIRRFALGLFLILLGAGVLYLKDHLVNFPLAIIPPPEDPVSEIKNHIQREEYQQAIILADLVLENRIFYSKEVLDQVNNLKAEAMEKENSFWTKAKRCATGVFKGEAVDWTSLACVGISNFFVFGDIRDLLIEGYKWMTEGEVNEIVLILSGIGIGTTVLPASEVGINITKSFIKAKVFSDDLIRSWLRSADKQTEIRKSVDLLADLNQSYKGYGLIPMAQTVRYARDINDLEKINSLVKTYGAPTANYLILKTDGGILTPGLKFILKPYNFSTFQLLRIGTKTVVSNLERSDFYKLLLRDMIRQYERYVIIFSFVSVGLGLFLIFRAFRGLKKR